MIADDYGPPANMPQITVVGSTPLTGSDLNRDQVPETTRVLDAGDIERTGIPSLTRALLDNVASVTINDTEGNVFQPDILFRGFTASPVAGTSEGLAIYVNGARFNEAFGDTVNWDLIPPAAIESANLEAANPLFGLNALGGSISIRLKNGFTTQTDNLTAYGGSYGRAAAISNSAISTVTSRSMRSAMPPTTTAFGRPAPRICTGSTPTWVAQRRRRAASRHHRRARRARQSRRHTGAGAQREPLQHLHGAERGRQHLSRLQSERQLQTQRGRRAASPRVFSKLNQVIPNGTTVEVMACGNGTDLLVQ